MTVSYPSPVNSELTRTLSGLTSPGVSQYEFSCNNSSDGGIYQGESNLCCGAHVSPRLHVVRSFCVLLEEKWDWIGSEQGGCS